MKLKAYLDSTGIKSVFLAEKLGVNKSRISEWCNGKCKPRFETMKQIEKLTNGKVKPKDWFTE